MAEPEIAETAKTEQTTDSANGMSGAAALKAIAHLQQVAETLVADAARLTEEKSAPDSAQTKSSEAKPLEAEPARANADAGKTSRMTERKASAANAIPVAVDWRARMRAQIEKLVWSQAAAAAVMTLAIGGGAYLGLMDYLDRKETHRIAAEDALRHPPETAAEKQLRGKIAELTLDLQSVRGQVNKIAQDLRAAQTQSASGAAAVQTIARMEKLEKELAAKVDGQVARIDRLERLAADPVVTSSISKDPKQKGQPTSAAGAPAPVQQGLRTPDPTMKSNQFVLRSVHNGVAMVQTRRGMLEVAPGDTIPGVGRVRSIEKLDGRWVLVMQDGMIDQDED